MLRDATHRKPMIRIGEGADRHVAAQARFNQASIMVNAAGVALKATNAPARVQISASNNPYARVPAATSQGFRSPVQSEIWPGHDLLGKALLRIDAQPSRKSARRRG